MIKVPSLVLAAALFAPASAADCYALYNAGAEYSVGDSVAADVTETETCATGTTGCVNGSKDVTKRYNFECTSEFWCSNAGYAPGGIYSASAWSQASAVCTQTATPATPAPPAAWSGGGCPAAYAGGTDYSEGDAVSITKSTYKMVYQCKPAPADAWCGMAGYEPGTSTYWSEAWTELGSCAGTIAPTTSPVYVSIADAGGCPAAYAASEDYEEGDRVSKDGLVYQCKAWPNSAHCSQAGYEPMVTTGHVDAWKDAWSVVGYCEGTIAPTTSPNFVSLTDMGGCPDDWETRSGADPYEEGDKVAAGGLVFQCKAWPFSGHCGQAGYEPNTDPATPGAWKDAWTVVGYCSGSMGPTSSPTFDSVNHLERCPEEWSSGSNTKYEEGDMVSSIVSQEPLRKVAFKCKAWPFSGHCGQFGPTAFGGDLGWELAGTCGDGTYGPTASPSFDSLTVAAGGCPGEWGTAGAYEAGDLVAVSVSSSPVRQIVYRCKPWPNTGYCNQAGFKPVESQYDYMAWELVGACEGTMAPTLAPVVYSGTCQYDQCRDVESTCTPGSAGCSCAAGQTASSSCKKTENVCTPTDVDAWTSTMTYETGDVVRVGLDKFTCRPWPNYLWCSNEAYKPTAEAGIWTDAWVKGGVCA